ncbi:hypothetical protein P0136_00930 [Lentisphaerota bacterium ZTH]|nr:hypothetical protein JYG24_07930 [Lentisphaerota bacterium]WET06577.1 hypothetical protein P0136_00930 [Lentisphaerota bacterium ZTH]
MIINEVLREFLGWSLLLNIALMILSVIVILPFKRAFAKLHAKMFGISEKQVLRGYYQFMTYYKIAIIVLNLVPYIALVIMSKGPMF